MKRTIIVLILILNINIGFSQMNEIDTTWLINGQKFTLSLKLDPDSKSEMNSELQILKNSKSIIRDSILCAYLDLEWIDFNNDKFADLLVFQTSGARANATYNLYIYRSESHEYQKIENFNNWPNFNTTEIPGILAACILTGVVTYKFFQLTPDLKLIDLNIREVDSLLDGTSYNNGLSRVRNKIK